MVEVRGKSGEIRHLITRDWRFILATFAGTGASFLSTGAAPLTVQVLSDAGFDRQQVGDLATIELATLAVTSLLMTSCVARLSRRMLATVGVLLAAVGFATSALSQSFEAMVVGRLISGAGSGVAMAATYAAIAARLDAERIFAINWILGGLAVAALAIYLPGWIEGGNYPLAFGTYVALCVTALTPLIWIPPHPRPSDGSAPQSTRVNARVSNHGSPFSLPIALSACVAVLAYSIAEMALWPFAYSIPVESGIPYDLVNWVVGITALAGIIGGVVAFWLGNRRGWLLPLTLGSCLSVIGRWTYISAPNPEVLLTGSLLWGIGFYFVSPYQNGLAAALDRRGRVAVATGAMMNFGYAVGPTVGGRTLQFSGESALIAVITGLTLVSLLLLLPAARREDRRTRASL